MNVDGGENTMWVCYLCSVSVMHNGLVWMGIFGPLSFQRGLVTPHKVKKTHTDLLLVVCSDCFFWQKCCHIPQIFCTCMHTHTHSFVHTHTYTHTHTHTHTHTPEPSSRESDATQPVSSPLRKVCLVCVSCVHLLANRSTHHLDDTIAIEDCFNTGACSW